MIVMLGACFHGSEKIMQLTSSFPIFLYIPQAGMVALS